MATSAFFAACCASANPLLSVAEHAAAPRVRDLHVRGDLLPDSRQHRDDLLQDAVRHIIAELVPVVVRVRTDHRDGLEVLLERQHAFVLQQNDALLRHAVGQVLMLLGVRDRGGPLRIDIGSLEQAEREFLPQDAPDRPVDVGHRDLAFLDALEHLPHVAGLVRNADIHAGFHRDLAGFFLRGSKLLVHQRPDPAAFAQHQALEAKFLAQNLRQNAIRSHGSERRRSRGKSPSRPALRRA